MKLNCRRIDFTYVPGDEIFHFPEESGLPFFFDIAEELTADPADPEITNELMVIYFDLNREIFCIAHES